MFITKDYLVSRLDKITSQLDSKSITEVERLELVTERNNIFSCLTELSNISEKDLTLVNLTDEQVFTFDDAANTVSIKFLNEQDYNDYKNIYVYDMEELDFERKNF